MSNDNAIARLFRLWAKVAMMVTDGKRDATEVADALQRILEQPQSRNASWREEDGVIYFNVTSDGTIGKEWLARLESGGFSVDKFADQLFMSDDFKPTKGVVTEIAVLRGASFTDSNRTTKNIRAIAEGRKLSKPNAEVACLIREKFSNKEIQAMGLTWIVVMHEPINDSSRTQRLLSAYRYGGDRGIYTCRDKLNDRWNAELGFAFAVSETKA